MRAIILAVLIFVLIGGWREWSRIQERNQQMVETAASLKRANEKLSQMREQEEENIRRTIQEKKSEEAFNKWRAEMERKDESNRALRIPIRRDESDFSFWNKIRSEREASAAKAKYGNVNKLIREGKLDEALAAVSAQFGTDSKEYKQLSAALKHE